MIVYCVTVRVKEGHEEDFRVASKINHLKTRKEMGNIRFDVLQSEDDPGYFMLYEAYRSDEAVAAHKASKHYKVWRDTVAPWMSVDRVGEKFTPRFPKDESEW